jgi:hypothetical protein
MVFATVANNVKSALSKPMPLIPLASAMGIQWQLQGNVSFHLNLFLDCYIKKM